jgi:hypothetical protein
MVIFNCQKQSIYVIIYNNDEQTLEVIICLTL